MSTWKPSLYELWNDKRKTCYSKAQVGRYGTSYFWPILASIQQLITVRYKTVFPPSFELGTFRVWGERDNHYTMETSLCFKGANGESLIPQAGTLQRLPTKQVIWSAGESQRRRCGQGRSCRAMYFETLLVKAKWEQELVSTQFRTGDLSRVRRTW